MYEDEAFTDICVGVSFDTESLGARYAIYELKQHMRKILVEQESVLGSVEERKRLDIERASQVNDKYENRFGMYCREMLIFKAKYDRYPLLKDFELCKNFSYSEKVTLFRQAQSMSNENFLFFCGMAAQARFLLKRGGSKTDEEAIQEVIDDITKQIPPWRRGLPSYEDFLDFDEFDELDEMAEFDELDELGEMDPRLYQIVDVSRRVFLKTSFDAMPEEELIPGDSVVDQVIEKVMDGKDRERYDDLLIKPSDVLDSQAVDVVVDVSMCNDEEQLMIWNNSSMMKVTQLSFCTQRPRYMMVRNERDRKYGKKVVVIGHELDRQDPDTVNYIYIPPANDIQRHFAWMRARKKWWPRFASAQCVVT